MLVVIDAMKPAMLHSAIAEGRAPALTALMERGSHVDDCISAFPSVTPVCAATIATGLWQEHHDIPAMNWYHRGQGRYVEYGTSFRASQAFGFKRSLTDTIYNMNGEHLAPDAETVFETLDDAGLRTAGTTFLIHRGRHAHQPADDTALARIASAVFRHPVLGPREFFYADLFASRRTPCHSQFGLPGSRDQHAGCVGEHLVEQDLFDFLLLSLPDNDSHSHRRGPDAQKESLAAADTAIRRVMDAAGGIDAFLDQHAVIVCSDHSQSAVRDTVDLFDACDEWRVQQPTPGRRGNGSPAELALCPNSRAAYAYLLQRGDRRAARRVERTLASLDGVELTMRLTDHPDGEVSVRRPGGELRFGPGGRFRDLRGSNWRVDGDFGVLGLEADGNTLWSAAYPDPLARIWSALRCPAAGDVMASAAVGHEFLDWGRGHHVGGGSHGSLHAEDSLATLMWCGTGPERADSRAQWTLADIAPMVRAHFGARTA
jgi:opacity protein-like surface antigen